MCIAYLPGPCTSHSEGTTVRVINQSRNSGEQKKPNMKDPQDTKNMNHAMRQLINWILSKEKASLQKTL